MTRSLPISVLVVLLGTGVAHAERERTTALAVTGGYAIVGIDENAVGETVPMLGASLAWDRTPPAYPLAPGYRWAGDLVPEVTLARIGDDAILMSGVRLELDYAQREQGLFRISGRGSLWIAPRLAVLLEDSQLLAGGEVGASMRIRSSGWTFGYWFGVLGWPADDAAAPPPDSLALAPDTGLLDRPPPGSTLTFLAGLTLSRAY
jgi:hypothetical protein